MTTEREVSVEEMAMLKTCSICGEERALGEFRRDANRPDGHRAHCKTCANAMDREYRKTISPEQRRHWDAEYRRKHRKKITLNQRVARAEAPQKSRAWNTLNKAVRRGVVSKHPCEVCGSMCVEGHHGDYSKKLDVRWLCHKHHMKLMHGGAA